VFHLLCDPATTDSYKGTVMWAVYINPHRSDLQTKHRINIKRRSELMQGSVKSGYLSPLNTPLAPHLPLDTASIPCQSSGYYFLGQELKELTRLLTYKTMLSCYSFAQYIWILHKATTTTQSRESAARWALLASNLRY